MAGEVGACPVLVVFDTPAELCDRRNAARADLATPPHRMAGYHARMALALNEIRSEEWAEVLTVRPPVPSRRW